MVEAIEAAAGAPADELSADAGYCSEDNLETLTAHGIRGSIATGRQKRAGLQNLDSRLISLSHKPPVC